MVGRMPKRKIDPSEFAGQFTQDEVQETPEQKRQRIAQAIQNAQSLVGDINSGNRITRQIAKDDQVMRKAYRRAVNEGMSLNDLAAGLGGMPGLSMSDVMLPDIPMPRGGQQFLTEEFPTNQDDMIMEEVYQQPRQVQQRPRQVLQETKPIRSSDIYRSDGSGRKVTQSARPPIREATSVENWKAKRYIGETRGGNEVPVWRIENAKTGSKLQTLFRIESVANRVTMMLNESGDLNDPRVVSLVNAYVKRDKLLKEARALEKSADGKVMKTERLRQIRAEINQLEYRLGV